MGLERGLDILECLAAEGDQHPQKPGLRFTTLHQRLGIAKPVLSRLLKSLIARGYVVKLEEQRRYIRGAAVVHLSRRMERAPYQRRVFTQLATEVVRQVSVRFAATAMALYWDGQMLESVATAMVEDGLAAWPEGTRRDHFQRGPWGMFILLETQEDPRPRVESDPRAMDLELIDQCMRDIQTHDTLILDRRHCVRAVAAVRSGDGALIGEIGILAPSAQFDDGQRCELRQALRAEADALGQRIDCQTVTGGAL